MKVMVTLCTRYTQVAAHVFLLHVIVTPYFSQGLKPARRVLRLKLMLTRRV